MLPEVTAIRYMWHGGLRLIDHGAALIWHHDWARAGARAVRAYDATDHALNRFVTGDDVRRAATTPAAGSAG